MPWPETFCCVTLLGKTLYSHTDSVPLHPDEKRVLGVAMGWTSIPSSEERKKKLGPDGSLDFYADLPYLC